MYIYVTLIPHNTKTDEYVEILGTLNNQKHDVFLVGVII